MPILKAKSRDNMLAADVLRGRKLYAPSIHCYYYSCFQLSKYLLKTRGKDYKTQDSECKGKDSHKLIIRETKKYTSAPWPYKREMDRLKGLRAKADYDNVEISPYDADKALLIANKLHKLLGI